MAEENINAATPKDCTTNLFPNVQKAYTGMQPILNEWTNHSAFYAVFPSYYFTFGQFWLRKWLQWFDGFVPGIHDGNSGIISTRLATTLCYRLAEQVFGGGLLYASVKKTDDASKALEFVSDEGFNDAFSNEALKAFVLAAAGGTSYAKVNIDNKGKPWVDTWRADQAYADVDFKGEVVKARFLCAQYTKLIPPKQTENRNYYLVEDRFICNEGHRREYAKRVADKIPNKWPVDLLCGKSYAVYRIYSMQGTVNDFQQGVNLGRELNWEEIPNDIRKGIRESFGVVEVNKPILLPFLEGDLGVQMFKWTSFISNLPQLPFGESVIAKIQAYLYEYDFKNSCMNTDMYLGRGRVLVPKSLQSPKPVNFGGTAVNGVYNQGLDSFLFTKVEYASTEDKKPEAIQFDLRSSEWAALRNLLLENIATAIGISPSTIASYLNDSSARTAREISSEESATSLFVENRRKLFKKPLNRLLKTILLLNGFTDCISVKFSASGQTNTTLLVENTTREYSAGLRSEYSSVKKLNPDASEEELQEELNRIHADQEAKTKLQGRMFSDTFNDKSGNFGSDNENTQDFENELKAKANEEQLIEARVEEDKDVEEE